jgi:CheY-like chemotaxis protein
MLSDRRVLIVEDEHLVACVLEELLRSAGCVVLGPIGGFDEAVAAARFEAIDIAVLDVDLAGRRVFPVADILVERHIPFIFTTGFGRDGLPEAYADRPALAKPFRTRAVLELLRTALDCSMAEASPPRARPH